MEPSEAIDWEQFSEVVRQDCKRKFAQEPTHVGYRMSYGDQWLLLAPLATRQTEERFANYYQPSWEPWASDTFATVEWKHKVWTFGPKAAKIVKRLWEAWQTGKPDVEGSTLLDACGAGTTKFTTFMRTCKAFGTVIVPGPGTCYRLNFPPPGVPTPRTPGEAEE